MTRVSLQPRCRTSCLEDARTALVDDRDRGQIDDAVARHIERYLDLHTMRLDYPDWDIDASPFEALIPPPATDG